MKVDKLIFQRNFAILGGCLHDSVWKHAMEKVISQIDPILIAKINNNRLEAYPLGILKILVFIHLTSKYGKVSGT
jgi:hypothetical protein